MGDVFEKHKKEIEMCEGMLGVVDGRLFYAVSILSDVQHMVGDNEEINDEINEVKQLIISILKQRGTDTKTMVDVQNKLGESNE